MKIDRLLEILQACLDSGFTEVELVANHPDSGQRIEYNVSSVEYFSPVVYIHVEDE